MKRDRPSDLFFATNNASRGDLGSNFPTKHIGNLLRIWKLGFHVFQIPAKLALNHPIHVSPQTARSRPEYSAERASAQRPFDSPPRCTPRERAEQFYESHSEEQANAGHRCASSSERILRRKTASSLFTSSPFCPQFHALFLRRGLRRRPKTRRVRPD